MSRHAGADLCAQFSELVYNSKSDSFGTACDDTALILKCKSFYRNRADRVVGILHEAHGSNFERGRPTNFSQQQRLLFQQNCIPTSSDCGVKIRCQLSLGQSEYVSACMVCSFDDRSRAHESSALHFGGGWVLLYEAQYHLVVVTCPEAIVRRTSPEGGPELAVCQAEQHLKLPGLSRHGIDNHVDAAGTKLSIDLLDSRCTSV